MTTGSTRTPAQSLKAEHLRALVDRAGAAAPEFTTMADAIWDDPEMRWEEFRPRSAPTGARRDRLSPSSVSMTPWPRSARKQGTPNAHPIRRTPPATATAATINCSALDAVELLIVGTNFLREHMPDSASVHYAITDAGGRSANVVQAHSSVYYVVRAEDTRQMQELYERVVKIARGAELMTETKLEIEFDGACAEVLPNEVLERALDGVLRQLGPVPFDAADQVTAAGFAVSLDDRAIAEAKREVGWNVDDQRALHDDITPLHPEMPRAQGTGSTDVGDVSWVVPTVQVSSSTAALGTPFHAWQTVAQGELPSAHKGMIHAATSMAATATAIATDSQLLAEAQKEHTAITARTPYLPPIPESVVAPPLRTDGRSAGQ